MYAEKQMKQLEMLEISQSEPADTQLRVVLSQQMSIGELVHRQFVAKRHKASSELTLHCCLLQG